MIFLTVGTQLPFDRLVKTVDLFAAKSHWLFKAQIGKSSYHCVNMQASEFYPPDEMNELFNHAEVIVSHAGMGSIINALKLKKTIILFPRLSKFGEHRNDHQLDTLASFSNIQGIYVAEDEAQLLSLLEQLDQLEKPQGLETPERQRLVNKIKEFCC
ncbi:beta(1,3)galactosyltransferase EpsH [Vibrio sp. AK197]|uniref:Glycosyltransferase n=1 Tax=Vibrio olivae TaxID=1243002 RepID=A0ABV5HNC3_9VIBR